MAIRDAFRSSSVCDHVRSWTALALALALALACLRTLHEPQGGGDFHMRIVALLKLLIGLVVGRSRPLKASFF